MDESQVASKMQKVLELVGSDVASIRTGRATPAIDAEIIRISLPPMTGEDREKYVKLLSTKIENGRIMIRQIRGDVMHDVKKAFEDKEVTDEYIKKIEEMGENKKEELLQV